MDEYLKTLADKDLYALVSEMVFDVQDANNFLKKAQQEIATRRGSKSVEPGQIRGALAEKIRQAKEAKENAVVKSE
jgi:hypothetical protein